MSIEFVSENIRVFTLSFVEQNNRNESDGPVISLLSKFVGTEHVRHNQHGQVYDEGKSYPQVIRENVLDLYNAGLSYRKISTDACVSVGFVNKVTREYNENNFSMPKKALCGRKKSPVFEDVVSYVEIEKLSKPSIYSYELQNRLLLDGVCMPNEIPAKAIINKYLRQDLRMSKNEITSIPSESIQGPNIDCQNEFLAEISTIDPITLHFFDETSVIHTEGNKRYGNSATGEPALEYQKYASNATYTVNLLQSVPRVDHYNILDGPSNGAEMLLFFDDALTLENPDGSVVLERGDTIVMDNCGFHHGCFAC